MERIYFFVFLTFAFIINLIGQSGNYNHLYSDWFLIDLKTHDGIDTLTFAKEKADSSFKVWSFNKNDTLHIYAGFETDNKHDKKKNERMEICYESSYYRFSLDKQKGKISFIKDNSTHVYDIINSDSETLILTAKKQYSYKQINDASKKIKYYFFDIKSDSSIFKLDTIKVTKIVANIESPRIEVINNSNFTFTYNIDLDTIVSVDKTNNSETTMVIEKSKQIDGDWILNDLQNKVRLIFKNSTIMDYDIVENATEEYFIRKR